MEFGCNDGTLLQFLQKYDLKVKGMDASENVVARAHGKGLDVQLGFFGNDSGIYKKEEFDLITCSNVYAHVKKIAPLTREAWRILKKNGILLIEVHNASIYYQTNLTVFIMNILFITI